MKYAPILIGLFSSALGQQFRLSRAPPLVSVRLATEGSFPNSNRGKFKNDISQTPIGNNRRLATEGSFLNSNRGRFKNDISQTLIGNNRILQNGITSFESTENLFKPFAGFQNDIPLTVTSGNSFETNVGFQNNIPSTGTLDNSFDTIIGFQNNIPSVGSSGNTIDTNFGFQNNIPSTGTFENSFDNDIRLQNDIPSTVTFENSFDNDIGFQNDVPSSLTFDTSLDSDIRFQNDFPSGVISDNTPFPATLLTPVMLTSDRQTGTISFSSARQTSRRNNQGPNESNFQFSFPSIFSNTAQEIPRDTPIRPVSAFLTANSPSTFLTSNSPSTFPTTNSPSTSLATNSPSTFLTTNSPSQVVFEPLNLPSGASALLGSISTRFSCEGLPYGYYADPDNSCNIFHICNPTIYEDGFINTFQYSFMCGETLVFDQQELACVTPDNISHACRDAPSYFFRNEIFGTDKEA